MPTSQSVISESAIVSKLRAAGCVFAEDEARLLLATGPTPAELLRMLDKRVAGFPLEHILGWAEFCGLQIAVDTGVFVPRRRSELLVRVATALTAPGAVVLDLCCGSGALGTALSAAISGIAVYATDIDPVAVACTRRNLAAAGGHVYAGDLFEPLPRSLRGHIDILLCNTPYVPTHKIATMPPEARLHEPRGSLDGGPDGLDVQRRVAVYAPRWLAPGGHLILEASKNQSPHAAKLLAHNGLLPRIVSSEALDATVVIGTKPLRPR